MSKFPKISDWSEKAYSASMRGFNLLIDFEKEMHKAYPDLRPFTFGFFSESDINERTTEGWVHLKSGMWDMEDWNLTVGLRFGLRTDGGDNVMYNNNYIMMMPRKHREEIILPARLEAIKRVEAAAKDDQVVVHPSDPEFNKMKDAGRKIAKSESVKVQVRGEPERGETKEADDNLW